MKPDEMIKALRELEGKARVSDFTSETEDKALRKAIRTLKTLRQLFPNALWW